MELTKEQKITMLDETLLTIKRGNCICYPITTIYCQKYNIYAEATEILPEFGAMKPFFKSINDFWFGKDVCLDKNIQTRSEKVMKLINLYQRDIPLELWLWRQVAKVKRIFIK